jgi:hypothetical protein
LSLFTVGRRLVLKRRAVVAQASDWFQSRVPYHGGGIFTTPRGRSRRG